MDKKCAESGERTWKKEGVPSSASWRSLSAILLGAGEPNFIGRQIKKTPIQNRLTSKKKIADGLLIYKNNPIYIFERCVLC